MLWIVFYFSMENPKKEKTTASLTVALYFFSTRPNVRSVHSNAWRRTDKDICVACMCMCMFESHSYWMISFHLFLWWMLAHYYPQQWQQTAGKHFHWVCQKRRILIVPKLYSHFKYFWPKTKSQLCTNLYSTPVL